MAGSPVVEGRRARKKSKPTPESPAPGGAEISLPPPTEEDISIDLRSATVMELYSRGEEGVKKLSEENPELLAGIQRLADIQIAQLYDDAQGFAAFYELIHGAALPKHTRKEWIEPLYLERAGKKGLVIEAFRGSTKTTTMNTFMAWRIGKEPHKATLLIQVGDDTANDNTAAVADIIMNNSAWKEVFPNVVPDIEKGWGAGGYEVKRRDMDYPKWRELCSSRKDPTLLGVGYKSREIIGRHPDGLLIVDDIHDENNTSSERELATVRKILTGTIFPTMTPSTWAVFVGTPWVENDMLQYVKGTGEFVSICTPVYRMNENEEKVYTWPKKFGEVEVEAQRRLNGRLEFARMFLLDLTAAKNRVFKYQGYPHEQIKAMWPMVGGCDYASNRNAYKNQDGKGDYFALAYVAKLPGGGAVVVDGVIDRCTQAASEGYINRAQNIFPMWQTCIVESVGKGDDFVQVLMRNPLIKIVPMHSGSLKKQRRLEIFLSPWLENGMVRISDAETPFLNELRDELDNYPENTHDDAMDAVYYALKGMPDVLTIKAMEEELPLPFGSKKAVNPVYSLGRT